MAIQVGQIFAPIGGDTSGFDSAIDSVHSKGIRVADQISRKFKQMGDQMTQTGKMLTARVSAPLAALSGLMVKNFDKQAQAEAQVRQGVISTGKAAGRTAEELLTMASGLQEISRFGDEDILQGVTAQILTFTNIAGEQFDRTQKAALDLAARLGGDLQSSSIMLGKALNDPVANLGALGRAGIQFSADQKDVIKQLAETGRVAEAQRIILTELEKQYGGSAEAAAKAGAGPIVQLKNAIGDLTEEFGNLIMDGMKPWIERIKDAVKWVSRLDDRSKELIVRIGKIAFAIGPATIAFGMLAKAIAVTMSPIVLITAGIVGIVGALDYVRRNLKPWGNMFERRFAAIKNKVVLSLAGIAEAFDLLFSVIPGISSPLEGVKDSLIEMISPLPKMEAEFQGFGDYIGDVSNDIGVLLDVLKEKFGSIFTLNPEEATQSINSIQEPVDALIEDFSELNAIAEEWGNIDFSHRITDEVNETSNAMLGFANVTGQVFSQAVLHANKLEDVLSNILKQLASKAFVVGLGSLLTGGASLGGKSFLSNVFGGLFHGGGIVGGSGERMIKVKGGEGVFTQGQMKAMGSIQPASSGLNPMQLEQAFSRALSAHTKKLGPEDIYTLSRKGQHSF